MQSEVWLILKVVHGVIGMAAGICGCAVFATKYGNRNAAIWAAISAFVALLYVQVNRSVYRDLQRAIIPKCFLMYIITGGVFMAGGFAGMITYLVIGISNKEDLNPKGSYVALVWTFMTFKWALILLLSARKLYKQYSEIEGNELVIAIND